MQDIENSCEILSLLLLMSCTLTWQVNFYGSFTLTESNSDSVNISIGLFENQMLNYSIKFLMPFNILVQFSPVPCYIF